MKNQKQPMENGLPWHTVEGAVQKEKRCLSDVFDFGQEWKQDDEEKENHSPLSSDEMLRQISLSILRGDIQAREIKSDKANGLWTSAETGDWEWEAENATERHRGPWHRRSG